MLILCNLSMALHFHRRNGLCRTTAGAAEWHSYQQFTNGMTFPSMAVHVQDYC
jgi:hypothetical protein